MERQNAAHLLVEELNQWVIVLEVEGLKGRARQKITAGLGAFRTWGIESEKAAERGQILTISLAHSGTMVQESGEIWTA